MFSPYNGFLTLNGSRSCSLCLDLMWLLVGSGMSLAHPRSQEGSFCVSFVDATNGILLCLTSMWTCLAPGLLSAAGSAPAWLPPVPQISLGGWVGRLSTTLFVVCRYRCTESDACSQRLWLKSSYCGLVSVFQTCSSACMRNLVPLCMGATSSSTRSLSSPMN